MGWHTSYFIYLYPNAKSPRSRQREPRTKLQTRLKISVRWFPHNIFYPSMYFYLDARVSVRVSRGLSAKHHDCGKYPPLPQVLLLISYMHADLADSLPLLSTRHNRSGPEMIVSLGSYILPLPISLKHIRQYCVKNK